MKRFFVSLLLSGIFLLLLLGCSMQQRYSTAGQDIQSTLNSALQNNHQLDKQAQSKDASINNALLPPLTVPLPNNSQPPQKVAEHRFDVSADDLPAKSFFLGLVAGTSYNMLVNDDMTGKITLHLKNVTIDQVLDATREMYGYEYKKTAVGYEILPPKMTTQIFNVNYLNIKRSGQSQTQLVSTELTDLNNNNNGTGTTYAPPVSSGSTTSSNTGTNGTNIQGSGSTVVTKAENDFWSGLSVTLQTLVGTKEGRWVVVNPQASIVMVHAYPNELHEVSDYLHAVQKNLQREVIIEAKILEVSLNDNYQAGINWKVLTANQLGTTNGVGLDSDFNTTGNMFSMTLSGDHGNFTSVINLLAEQGNVQVLSSPHISTTNNQEAVIKVGSDQFFVTGYTSNITPTGSTNTTSQSVALNPFFSGITLDVTPQISEDSSVTLYIHPSISNVQDQTKTIQLGEGSSNTLVLPLALSKIRESDNVVHAQNGQVVVIGGLMQKTTEETVAGTPGLSKVPIAGALARNTNQTAQKTELVILLRPIVVGGNDTWDEQLTSAQKGFATSQRGFHLGGLPEDFGMAAEKTP